MKQIFLVQNRGVLDVGSFSRDPQILRLCAKYPEESNWVNREVVLGIPKALTALSHQPLTALTRSALLLAAGQHTRGGRQAGQLLQGPSRGNVGVFAWGVWIAFDGFRLLMFKISQDCFQCHFFR